uniref:non-specific serine/threonine protein kinase n=1 Tax=Albugo laibachii Nc14 TaxID=890382 RepID=F0WEY2_9STRA|nr:phosphatidylinositol kinase putative [Albugo laibachii Nc14]|eukprot:CCA19764.1 phosphatidylinositol kinase putative [Albugo laibachii Nc14]
MVNSAPATKPFYGKSVPPAPSATNTQSIQSIAELSKAIQRLITATNADGDAISLKQRNKTLTSIKKYLQTPLETHKIALYSANASTYLSIYNTMEPFFSAFLDILSAPLTKSVMYQSQHQQLKDSVLEILSIIGGLCPRKCSEWVTKFIVLDQEYCYIEWTYGILMRGTERIPLVHPNGVGKASTNVQLVEGRSMRSAASSKNDWNERTVEYLEWETALCRITQVWKSVLNSTEDETIVRQIVKHQESLLQSDRKQLQNAFRNHLKPHFIDIADVCVGWAMNTTCSDTLRLLVIRILELWQDLWSDHSDFSLQLLTSFSTDIEAFRDSKSPNNRLSTLIVCYFIITACMTKSNSMHRSLFMLLRRVLEVVSRVELSIFHNTNDPLKCFDCLLSVLSDTQPEACIQLLSGNFFLSQTSFLVSKNVDLDQLYQLLQRTHTVFCMEPRVIFQPDTSARIVQSKLLLNLLFLRFPDSLEMLLQIAVSCAKQGRHVFLHHMCEEISALISDRNEEEATFYATCVCKALACGTKDLICGHSQTIFTSIARILDLKAEFAGCLALHMLFQLYAFMHRHKLPLPEVPEGFLLRLCALLNESYWPQALKVLVKASKSVLSSSWTYEFMDWLQWKRNDAEFCRVSRQMCLQILGNIADAFNDNEEVCKPLVHAAMALSEHQDTQMRVDIARSILSKIWAVASLSGNQTPRYSRPSLLPKVCESVLSILSAPDVSMEQWWSLERVMFVHANRQSAHATRNASDLVRDAAAYCVLSRLRTSFGGPTQTLAHLEAVLDRFSAYQPIDWIAFSHTKKLFVEFIGHLELCVARVTSEKADLLGEMDPSDQSKVVSFFRVNARVCGDWFDRIHPKVCGLCIDQKGEKMARTMSFFAMKSLTQAFQQAEHRFQAAQAQKLPLEELTDLRNSLIALDSALYQAARPLATLKNVDELFGLQEIASSFTKLPVFKWFTCVQQLAELRYEDALKHLDAFFEPLRCDMEDLNKLYLSQTTFHGCVRDYVLVCCRLRRWNKLIDFMQKFEDAEMFGDAQKLFTLQRYASAMQRIDNGLLGDSLAPWTAFEADKLAEWDLYAHVKDANSIGLASVTERMLLEPILEAPQLLFLGHLDLTHVENQMKLFSVCRDPSSLDACLWCLPLFYANPSPKREEFALQIAQLARIQRNFEFSERILHLTCTQSTWKQYEAMADTQEPIAFCLRELKNAHGALPSVKEAVALSLIDIGQVQSAELDAQLERIQPLTSSKWKRLQAAVHLSPASTRVWLAYSDWCYAFGSARNAFETQSPMEPLFRPTKPVPDADPTEAFGVAIDGYTKYANLVGKSASVKLCVRFLRLLMQCEWMPSLLPKLSAYFSTCALSIWLEMVAQLVARLSHPCDTIVSEVSALLCRLATQYPQRFTYIIVVEALKQKHSVVIDRVMTILRSQSSEHVERVTSVVHELQRVSVLWEEAWILTLTKLEADVSRRASTLTKEAARVAKNTTLSSMEKKALGHRKYKALMRPILKRLQDVHNETIGSSRLRTPHENRFITRYSDSITSAIQPLKLHCTLSDTEEVPSVAQVWAPFTSLLEALVSTTRESRPLDEISPVLATLASHPVPLPGVLREEPLYITGIDPNVTILKTKTKPKQLHFFASDGQSFRFLLKAREDLRLDDRVMQFLRTMNQFLDPELPARMYSVLPLSETAGLIQMVPKVTSFYHIYSTWKSMDKRTDNGVPTAAFYAKLREHGISQTAPSRPHETLKSIYCELAGQMPRDVLKHEIMSQADDIVIASRNLERLQKSIAIMSVLGYILGVGDRHLDNILLIQETGEALHIDFNVCFDRGRMLKVPERVPFRLTPMMKDVVRIQKSFQRVIEDTLRRAREPDTRESILTLMEAFVYDPLVEWTAGMDAQNQERSRMELHINMSLFLSRAEERRQQANDFGFTLEKVWKSVSEPRPAYIQALMDDFRSFQTLLCREKETRARLETLHAKAAAFLESNQRKLNVARERLETFMEECRARHEQIVRWKAQVTQYDASELVIESDRSLDQFIHRFRAILASCGSYVTEYAKLHRDANACELEEDVYFEWWKRCEKLLSRVDSMGSIELRDLNSVDESLWNRATSRALEVLEEYLMELDGFRCDADVQRVNDAYKDALSELECDLNRLKDSLTQVKLSNAQHHRFLKLVCSEWIRTVGNRVPSSLAITESLTCSLGAAIKLSNLPKSSFRRLEASELLEASEESLSEIFHALSSAEKLELGMLEAALELLCESKPRNQREMEEWKRAIDDFIRKQAVECGSETQEDLHQRCLRISRGIRHANCLDHERIQAEMEAFVAKDALSASRKALQEAVCRQSGMDISDWEAFLMSQLNDILPSTCDVGKEWFHAVESAIDRVRTSLEKASNSRRELRVTQAREAMIRSQRERVECRRRYLLWTRNQCVPCIADRIATRPQLLSVLESHIAELDALLEVVNAMEITAEEAIKRVLQEFGDVMHGIVLIESSRREDGDHTPRLVDRVGKSLRKDLLDEQISLAEERERVLENEDSVRQLKVLSEEVSSSLECVQLGKEECLGRMHETISARSKEVEEYADSMRESIHDFVVLLQGLEKQSKTAKRDAETPETLGAFFAENERLGNILLRSVLALKEGDLDALRQLLEAHERKCGQVNALTLVEWKEPMQHFLDESNEVIIETPTRGRCLQPLLSMCLALEDAKTRSGMEDCVESVQECLGLFFRITQNVYEISAMQSVDPIHTEASEKHNRYGIQVMERIHSKLDGQVQSYPQGTLSAPMSVPEQAQWLIDEATSVDNLCEMYEGWTPWI